MDVAPRLSPIEALILDLLITRQRMYGLELVEAAPTKLKRGTVYVTLGRMEDKGFVKSTQAVDEGLPGKPRRYYEATGTGARALSAARAAYKAFTGQAVPDAV